MGLWGDVWLACSIVGGGVWSAGLVVVREEPATTDEAPSAIVNPRGDAKKAAAPMEESLAKIQLSKRRKRWP